MPETASSSSFNPEMMKLAREVRSMSQMELARHMGVQQPHLSRVENGFRTPAPEFLEALCDVLDFPEDFFYQDEKVYGFGVGELFHRRKQDIRIKVLDKIHAEINLKRLHVARLLSAIEIPDCNIPHVEPDEEPIPVEEVARLLRAKWLMPRGPVGDLCEAIEQAGGIIIPCSFETVRIDAISQWIPRMPPLFFTNAASPKDRLRYSLAHELGHMVCHANLGALPEESIEKEANRFGAEFLMPERDISGDFDAIGRLTIESLAELKRKWRVSMAALLVRAHTLRKITDGQNRWLRIQLGKLGYLRQEPPELEPGGEEPRTFKEMISLHTSELGYTVEELARLLKARPPQIRAWYLPRPHLHAV